MVPTIISRSKILTFLSSRNLDILNESFHVPISFYFFLALAFAFD